MESSYSHWSGVLKSTSAMTKMDAKSYHRRSRANSSALPVQLVRKWPDVPFFGSGSLASGALPPEFARKQPGETPKIDLQGVDSSSTKLVRAPRQTPLRRHPYYAAAVAWPSDAIGGPDRDQSHLLCTPTRAAWAALWGHAIILAPSAALNTPAVLICMSADPALISQNSVVLLYEFLLQESHQF